MKIQKKRREIPIRFSLVSLITVLTLLTALTILSVSAAFYRNSINWVIEVLTQRFSEQLVKDLRQHSQAGFNLDIAKKIIHESYISPNSKIILFSENEKILVLAERKMGKLLPDLYQEKKEGNSVSITQIEDALLLESFQKYIKNKKKKERAFFKRKFDHYDFWHNFRKYTAIYKNFQLKEKTYLIAIVYPYRDFFKSFTRNNIILYSMVVFFVLLAIFIGIRVSKKISVPLRFLTRETQKIQSLNLESSSGVHSRIYEIKNMADAVENMRVGLRSFKKYVPSDLVEQLVAMKKEALLGGEKKNLTIFFSDIANFTSIAEQISPEVLVERLGEYLGEASEILRIHKATVDKYIGDAIMAFWGAPLEFSDHAVQACRGALAFQKKLTEMSANWKAQGKAEFSSRVGLNTGEVIVGNIGYEKRMNYTVIGDAVNLSSRIEGMNKIYGTSILIGQQTKLEVSHMFELRFIDIVAVKGKEKGVELYELISLKGEGDPIRLKGCALYEEALGLYLKREFRQAKQAFAEALSVYSHDLASQVLINRSNELIKAPPPQDWDGVFVATSK